MKIVLTFLVGALFGTGIFWLNAMMNDGLRRVGEKHYLNAEGIDDLNVVFRRGTPMGAFVHSERRNGELIIDLDTNRGVSFRLTDLNADGSIDVIHQFAPNLLNVDVTLDGSWDLSARLQAGEDSELFVRWDGRSVPVKHHGQDPMLLTEIGGDRIWRYGDGNNDAGHIGIELHKPVQQDGEPGSASRRQLP